MSEHVFRRALAGSAPTVFEREVGSAPSDPPAESGPTERPSVPDDGRSLVDGRYRVEGEIARGGMGVVYLATDAWLDRRVALKVLAPGWAETAAAAAGLHKEAKALASVKSRHVVQVYAFGPHDDHYYLAMEYIQGRSLRAITAEHARHGAAIPLHRALTILAQIAEGLDAVHAAGIVHRDVKPANIMIEEDSGRPVLVDFGLAASAGGDSSALPFAGTPRYMAPEQLQRGGAITPRTDVYALGCTAFELLTGRVPFDVEDHAQLQRRIARSAAPLVSSLRPDLTALDLPIATALAKDPADRQASCGELVDALLAADRRSTPERAEEPPPSSSLTSTDALRVLVVDDDPAFRKFVASAVQFVFALRVAVVTAASGLEALARAERRLPDLVLLDYDMPRLDGVDTLSRLRALPGGARTRVIVLSGGGAHAHRYRFSVLGVRDFVDKPADFRALVRSIGEVAERAGWRLRPEAHTTPRPR